MMAAAAVCSVAVFLLLFIVHCLLLLPLCVGISFGPGLVIQCYKNVLSSFEIISLRKRVLVA